MILRRPRPALGWCLAVFGGAGLGFASSFSNVIGSPYGPFTQVPGEGIIWLQFLSTWLDSVWAWALFPFLIGWIVQRPIRAVMDGTAGLLAAVAAYYVCDAMLAMTVGVEINAMSLWAAFAMVVGPVMSLIGAYARGTHFQHLIAALTAPAVMLYAVRRGTSSGPTQPWSDLIVICIAGLLTVALCARFVRSWRLRWWRIELVGSPVGDEERDESVPRDGAAGPEVP